MGGVELPPGSPFLDRYWISDDEVADAGELWSSLAEAYPVTGLWPVLVENFIGSKTAPWYDAEYYNPIDLSTVSNVDPLAVLNELWQEADVTENLRGPIGASLESLAPPDNSAPAPLTLSPMPGEYRLLLAAVARPADVIAVTGWTSGGVDTTQATAVLRSWEERFGWCVFYLGPDAMEIRVGQLSLNESTRLRLAAEVYAFSPSTMVAEGFGVTQFAQHLLDDGSFYFSW